MKGTTIYYLSLAVILLLVNLLNYLYKIMLFKSLSKNDLSAFDTEELLKFREELWRANIFFPSFFTQTLTLKTFVLLKHIDRELEKRDSSAEISSSSEGEN